MNYPRIFFLAIGLGAFMVSLQASPSRDENLILHYDKPATNWEREALPIGNGQMGAMIYGDPNEMRVQFNEESLWIGSEEDTGAYQDFGEIKIKTDGDEAVMELGAWCQCVVAAKQLRSLSLHGQHRVSPDCRLSGAGEITALLSSRALLWEQQIQAADGR